MWAPPPCLRYRPHSIHISTFYNRSPSSQAMFVVALIGERPKTINKPRTAHAQPTGCCGFAAVGGHSAHDALLHLRRSPLAALASACFAGDTLPAVCSALNALAGCSLHHALQLPQQAALQPEGWLAGRCCCYLDDASDTLWVGLAAAVVLNAADAALTRQEVRVRSLELLALHRHGCGMLTWCGQGPHLGLKEAPPCCG
jgi:hypothetical protein